MNFFEHQDQARGQTKKLIALLVMAVVALVLVTTFFVAILLHYTQGASLPSTEIPHFWQNFFQLLDWQLLFSVGAVVLFVVVIGSLYRVSQLRQGGSVVAESLNGKLLNITNCSGKEKRLLNIVEEMAIAAGVPVPPVYILDESGINAFAAGYDPKDAVIGVTKGCIEQLNREQLQGVIAHEYSHILHGDMRLNLRLVGVLHGILLIGLLGEILLRSGRHSRKNGGGIALLGVGLMVIGYAGTFCGNLIKSAVSRQREYLADASAVQFTRNPQGISRALMRIGGYSASSTITAESASEYSHFYFANGLKSWANSWFSTHPPLDDRIKRIDPQWQGDYLSHASIDEQEPIQTQHTSPNTAGFSALNSSEFSTSQTSQNAPTNNITDQRHVNAESISDQVGNMSEAAVASAEKLLAELNPIIRDACHNPASAMAIIYGLLFTQKVRLEQESLIGIHAPKPIFNLYKHYLAEVNKLPVAHRLPVIELCLPSLKALSDAQLTQFRQTTIALIKADNHLSLSEWCIFRLLQHVLFQTTNKRSKFNPIEACSTQIKTVLTLVAQQSSEPTRQQAYDLALTSLGLTPEILSTQAMAFPDIDKALAVLNTLKPLQKPRLLKALMLAIQIDNRVTISEYELLRVIADALNCPMPVLH